MTTMTLLWLILLWMLAAVTSVRHQTLKTKRPVFADWSKTSGVLTATTVGVRGSSVREFCDWETVNATCPGRNELVVIRSARYGRLRLNRCAAKSYGNLGCGADVTAMFAGICSARRSCQITVISLHGIHTTCPSDLKAYVELTYDCVRVSMQIPSVCDISSSELTNSPDTTLTTGLLSSFMARNGGQKAAGTRACPWSLRAAEYQRITLSIIEFRDPAASAAATAGGDDDMAFPSCVVVAERSETGNRSSVSMFCGGGRRRENLVYTSTSNVIDVYVANMTSSREFLIKYEAFGCRKPVLPPGAWLTYIADDRVVLRCNDTSSRDHDVISWTMTCRSSRWVGGDDVTDDICQSASSAVASLNPSVGSPSDHHVSADDRGVFYGVVVIVSIGIAVGVTVGILMLVLVLVYQRRYRQHKIKCRSELYAMKHSARGEGGGLCETDPPLISASNLGYGVTTAAAVDDLAMTSLPLPMSPMCRHYDSPYDVHRSVTWSRHHVVDNYGPDLADGNCGMKLTSGTAHTLCPRRHRQGCHDLSMAWPQTSSVQYSQPGGGSVHRSTSSQRRRPCSVSAADSTDGSPVRQTTSASHHCSEVERRDLCDKYGIVDIDVDRCGFSTRQPDAGLPPVDLDLVDGVMDRLTVDGGDPVAVTRASLLSEDTASGRREKNDLAAVFNQTPRRVNLDDSGTAPTYRPACNCGALTGTDRSPYYFKLDEVDGTVMSTSVTTDRSPLIAGRPLTSDLRHSDVIIGSQRCEQFK